ncbi:MAG: hypothetical protein WAW52_06525, partial [Methanothrix sp.]
YVGAATNGESTSAWGSDLRAKSDGFAAVGAGAGSLYLNHGLMQSPFFSGSTDNLGIEGAIAGAVAGGENSKASVDYIGAMTDGKITFAEGYKMLASGDKFAATGGGAVIRQDDYSVNPVWPYNYQDTQGALVADIGLGKDSSASADYISAGTDGDRTYALGAKLEAKGKTSAHAIAGAGEGIALVNGVLEIDQGSATGLSALENAAIGAEYMFAGTGDGTESFGIGMQDIGDKSALAYSASGEKLTVWADSVEVKDGTLAGLGAKGAGSQVMAENLFSSMAGPLLTSFGIDLHAQGEGAIAASASGDKISFNPDKANVEKGSLTGAAANGDASVTAAGLASFKDSASTLSIGDLLVAVGDKSAALATGKGEKVTIQSDEDKAKVNVEQGSITGVTAYKNARVAGDLLTSGEIQLDIGTLVLDGEGSLGTGLSGSGDESAAIASGTGDRVVIVADEDKGRAKVEKGSIAGVTAFDNAEVAGGLLASGQMQVAVGTQMLDGMGSAGIGLSGSGEKSASLATGSGDSVVIVADEDKGRAKVEKGAITGVTAYENAKVGSDLLASGDVQLAIGPLVLDGKGSLGTGLSASGDDSASGASGFGDEVFTKANNQMGEAKVTNGGIVGMAAHESAQVGADLMGSAGLTDGTVAGWIGLHPSATGTMSALGTGFGSEVNIEADEAIVETTLGSIIGLTASGQNSRTSADSIGGYETAGVSTLDASNILAQGDSASAASATSLVSSVIASDLISVNTGSVVGSVAKDGQVQADSLEFGSLSPSGTNLKASGTAASAASATGLSTVIESNKVSVNAGSVVGIAAEGDGAYVQADSLGFSSLLPSGTNLKASGTSASAASATSPLSTATIESDKISVNAGSVVGMAAEGDGAYVQADSLGFSSLYPSGTILKASGSSATAASATGLGMTVLETNKVTVNIGSLVGLATESGEVTADSLGYNGVSSIGSILQASGSKSVIAAGAGNKITLQPASATVESQTLDPNGVLLALGAGGNSQLSVASLEASKGLTTSVAKGSVLVASGQDYSMIGVASSGSVAGGTIINFQPSSGTSPYYGMTIPWGAYGGARTNGGMVTATTPLMAKSEVTSLVNTNYIIGGPNAGTSTKDYASLQATGTQPVVFAAYKGAGSSSVATKADGLPYKIWAYKSLALGNKEVKA